MEHCFRERLYFVSTKLPHPCRAGTRQELPSRRPVAPVDSVQESELLPQRVLVSGSSVTRARAQSPTAVRDPRNGDTALGERKQIFAGRPPGVRRAHAAGRCGAHWFDLSDADIRWLEVPVRRSVGGAAQYQTPGWPRAVSGVPFHAQPSPTDADRPQRLALPPELSRRLALNRPVQPLCCLGYQGRPTSSGLCTFSGTTARCCVRRCPCGW